MLDRSARGIVMADTVRRRERVPRSSDVASVKRCASCGVLGFVSGRRNVCASCSSLSQTPSTPHTLSATTIEPQGVSAAEANQARRANLINNISALLPTLENSTVTTSQLPTGARRRRRGERRFTGANNLGLGSAQNRHTHIDLSNDDNDVDVIITAFAIGHRRRMRAPSTNVNARELELFEAALQASLDDRHQHHNSSRESAAQKKRTIEACKLQLSTIELPKNCEGDACPICCDTFDSSKEVVQLQCQHLFDYDCISTWIATNNVCPICRAQCIDI